MRKQKFIVPLLLSSFAFTGLLANLGEAQGTKPIAPEYQMVKRANSDQLTRGTANDSKIYNELCKEIEGYVASGVLPEYHLKYYREGVYQQVYLKLGRGPEKIQNWAKKTEKELLDMVLWYSNDIKEFDELFKNLHVPRTDLSPNEALGMHFDGTFLNFYWTSEYNPYEGINLQSITLNGTTYRQQPIKGICNHLNGDGMFEITSTIHLPQSNLSIHVTPIGGFHLCKNDNNVYKYGIGLDMKDFKVSGFTANIDPIMNGIEPGTEDAVFGTKQKVISTDVKEFKFSEVPQYQKNAMMQLSTHCYVDITDIECQSQFDTGFGGYRHCVFFNTSLDLEDVYRVDTNYTVATDEKPWYNFIAQSGQMKVVKSLTPENCSGGLFGLGSYKGLKTGSFKSHEKEAKEYKYQLFLNYDADGWNLFHDMKADESKYTNVHDFKILRMNYLYKGKVQDVPIQMDEIDGKSVGLLDPKKVSDATTPQWKFEQGVHDVVDDVKNPDPDKDKNLAIILGCIFGTVLLYGVYKVLKLFVKLFKKDSD